MSFHYARTHPYTREDVAVRNNACIISEQEMLGEGAHRFVTLGKYEDGERKGEYAVAKRFKTLEKVSFSWEKFKAKNTSSQHYHESPAFFQEVQKIYEDEFFKTDIRATKKAELILVEFMNYVRLHEVLKFSRMMIKINIPMVWHDKAGGVGTKCLVEPYIQNFKKFNSNTGALLPEYKVAQALSHFSYHITQGECVLCDLQGGVSMDFDERSRVYTLSDVVVLSRKRNYGVTDLGEGGILNFFHHHRCNEFCNPAWRKPAFTKETYTPVMNTMFSTGELLPLAQYSTHPGSLHPGGGIGTNNWRKVAVVF